MKNYLDLLNKVLEEGVVSENRTGINTLSIPGEMLKFDLSPKGPGFPAVTTKRLAFNAVRGELIGFMCGTTNAATFRKLGCKIWDQNANENEVWLNSVHRRGKDDLGKIYGYQWRSFNAQSASTHPHPNSDQLRKAVADVIHNPTSRRIIVSAWNPLQINEMALPPCHVMFQLLANPQTKTLNMCMYQRSCDMFLGIPFNIASYALLLHLICQMTGYTPGSLTMFLADVHIYENHIEQVKEQLSRSPILLPKLSLPKIPSNVVNFDQYLQYYYNNVDKIELMDYVSHPAIRAPMAV